MPKIQGKQIAESTITQELLNLVTPVSGDTLSGATVEYVNAYIELAMSGVTTGQTGIIGPAEDGTYTDGLFTDFVESTPVGTAVDRFNETLLKLAPTPPETSWVGVFSNLTFDDEIDGMKIAGTITDADNITIDVTPDYTLTVSLPAEGMDAETGTFDITGPSGSLDSIVLTSGDDTRVNDISLTEGDPYAGTAGKENFWTAITSMSVHGTLPTLTVDGTSNDLIFTYPGGTATYSFYTDAVSTPTVTAMSVSFPEMTRYVSGVPSLAVGASITDIDFTLNNVVGYFYNPSMWTISGTGAGSDSNNPPTSTTTANTSVSETGHSLSFVSSSYAESITVTALGRNIDADTGTASVSSSVYRIDTVSNEATRLTSGAGSYPAASYGTAYDSEQVLTAGVGLNEMQLINGAFKYPAGDYSTFVDATNGAGPDYSSVTGTRWATFNVGSFTNNSAFTLTLNGASAITTIGQSNVLVEVKIEGATSWVNADSAFSNGTLPGSGADGLGAVVIAYPSTGTVRRITFGSNTYTGNIIVRIGFTGTGPSFTSLTASAIV